MDGLCDPVGTSPQEFDAVLDAFDDFGLEELFQRDGFRRVKA